MGAGWGRRPISSVSWSIGTIARRAQAVQRVAGADHDDAPTRGASRLQAARRGTVRLISFSSLVDIGRQGRDGAGAGPTYTRPGRAVGRASAQAPDASRRSAGRQLRSGGGRLTVAPRPIGPAAAGLAEHLAALEHHLAAAEGGLRPGAQLPPGVDAVAGAREQVGVTDRCAARASPRSTMSASEPTAIVPLRGYMPNRRAALVEVSATNRSSVSRPVSDRPPCRAAAAWCRARPRRSGRWATSSLGSSLSSRVQGAWSLAMVSIAAVAEAAPQRLLIGALAQRRLRDVERAVVLAVALGGQVQVERARLDEQRQPLGARRRAGGQRARRRQVHDVRRRAAWRGTSRSRARSRPSPPRPGGSRRSARDRRARDRSASSCSTRWWPGPRSGSSVMPPASPAAFITRVNCGDVRVERRHAHEDLHARLAAAHRAGRPRRRSRGWASRSRCGRRRRRSPGGRPALSSARTRSAMRLPGQHVGHVADAGDAARERGLRSAGVVVDPGGLARVEALHVQVDVRVDAAGQQQPSARRRSPRAARG